MSGYADVFCDSTGKKWTAIVGICRDGECKELERKEGMRTEYNAETALEAMWKRHNLDTVGRKE